MLFERYLDKSQEAIEYEKELEGGRRYACSQGETVLELLARKEEIIAEHERLMKQEKKMVTNRPLVEILAELLDSENDQMLRVVCHL
jgi:hypothetical protein